MFRLEKEGDRGSISTRFQVTKYRRRREQGLVGQSGEDVGQGLIKISKADSGVRDLSPIARDFFEDDSWVPR